MHIGTKRFLNIKQRPFELFGYFSLIFFIISYVPTRQGMDINLHDKYFVISLDSIYRVITGCFLIIWMIYVITQKSLLSKGLIWFHVVSTILPVIIILFMPWHQLGLDGIPRRYYAFTEFETRKSSYDFMRIYAIIPVIILITAQLVLLLNVICGFVKKMISMVLKRS